MANEQKKKELRKLIKNITAERAGLLREQRDLKIELNELKEQDKHGNKKQI